MAENSLPPTQQSNIISLSSLNRHILPPCIGRLYNLVCPAYYCPGALWGGKVRVLSDDTRIIIHKIVWATYVWQIEY